MDWAGEEARCIADRACCREACLTEALQASIATALRAAERRGMERAKAIANDVAHQESIRRGTHEQTPYHFGAFNVATAIQSEIDAIANPKVTG